ncbi:MAG: hypothetical protein ABL940_11975, partial [Bacteroidia bacterium]
YIKNLISSYIKSDSAYIHLLRADTAYIKFISSQYLKSDSAYINLLRTDSIFTNYMQAHYIRTDSIYAGLGRFDSLIIKGLSIDSLIKQITSNYLNSKDTVVLKYLRADSIYTHLLRADSAFIGYIKANTIKADTIIGGFGSFDSLYVGGQNILQTISDSIDAKAWLTKGNIATNSYKLGTLNARDLHIVTNNIETITVANGTGNVGIGQTLPAAKLDVLGNIQFFGDLKPAGLSGTTGDVLISQGTGVAPKWVLPSALGVTGPAGANGTNGKNSLLNTSVEPAGANCANGGKKVESGIDTDNSGVLDAGEVTATNYVCDGLVGSNGTNGANGTNGKNSLLKTTNEPAGVNCANGGKKVESGIDTNNSGVLDAGEVTATNYVCDGLVGSNGTNGANGTNGKNSLLNTSVEPAGANCANGGKKVESGIDTNNSGVLDAGEVTATNYVCDGATGATGPTGLTGAVGATGPAGPSGALNAWALLGNAGTVAGTNFLGTTDNVDVVFKRNNVQSGLLNSIMGNTSFGVSALNPANTGANNSALGKGALELNTTGFGNTAIGLASLNRNTTGAFNTATGASSLQNNTTGNNNTASGANSLSTNTTGEFNVANGNNSLFANTTGKSNIAVGVNALYSNTIGVHNIAIGSMVAAQASYAPLYANISGQYNIAIGSRTLCYNTTGGSNIAQGDQALFANTTGYNNIALGGSSMNDNTTGASNTSVGLFSLMRNTLGDYNTASGTWALSSNTTGIENTAIGHYAGQTNTVGNNNTYLGSNTDATANNLTKATAIGYNAKVGASNSMVLGGTGADAVNVGINTTTPTERLEIQGSIKIVDGTQAAGKLLTSDAAGKASWGTLSGLGIGNVLTTTYTIADPSITALATTLRKVATVTVPAGKYIVFYTANFGYSASTTGYNTAVVTTTDVSGLSPLSAGAMSSMIKATCSTVSTSNAGWMPNSLCITNSSVYETLVPITLYFNVTGSAAYGLLLNGLDYTSVAAPLWTQFNVMKLQ